MAAPTTPGDVTAAGPGWRAGRPWTAVATPRVVAAPLPLDPTAPTLVIAGPGAPPLDVGVPVVAEPSSAPWPGAVRTGPWLLGTPSLSPAQVVVAGRPTLHRAVARLLADPAVAVYALADERGLPWTDVVGSVRAVGALPPLRPDPEWLRRWATADKAAQAALDEALDTGPAGMQLARALVAALAEGTQLVLGSSNPVRDVALAAAPRDGVVVRSNRGVAGIDGTISTAVGAALAHDGPTVALLGDLTFLHDTTGLVIGPDEARPDLTIVVLDDRGGGIFHLLEQGAPEHAPAFERVFGTPHTVDLAACARRWAWPTLRRARRHRGAPRPPRHPRRPGARRAGRPASCPRRPSGSGRRSRRNVVRPRPTSPSHRNSPAAHHAGGTGCRMTALPAARPAPTPTARPRPAPRRVRGLVVVMSATLKATSLAAGHGARVLFSGLDLVDRARRRRRAGRGQRRGQVDVAADARGRRPPRGGRGRGEPAGRDRRAAAAGARAAPGRDRRGIPGPAHRRDRCPGRDGRGGRRPGRGRGSGDTYAVAWTAGSPSAAPTSKSARARWPPTSGWASGWTCR